MKSFVNYDLSNCKLDTDNETMIPTLQEYDEKRKC